jgi:hypothetical protein
VAARLAEEYHGAAARSSLLVLAKEHAAVDTVAGESLLAHLPQILTVSSF